MLLCRVNPTMTFFERHSRLAKETAYLLLFVLFGLVPFPMMIYAVGITIFGGYGGNGLGGFLAEVSSEFRGGEMAMIFLVLSPYIIWNLVRATLLVLRQR